MNGFAIERFRRVLVAVLAAGIALFFLAPAERPLAARPNFVVIQTDDQNAATVRARLRGLAGPFHRVMPHAVRQIINRGTEFRNYYASSPLCSPSRASLMSGQFPWNSGILANLGQNGGWSGWQNHAILHRNLPVTLDRHGYRTAHFGKFTNDYYDSENGQVDRTVPPGWDRWFTTAYEPGTRFYGYELNVDGRAVGPVGDPDYRQPGPGTDPASCNVQRLHGIWPTGNCRYLSDVMTAAAVRELRRDRRSPFFLQIDYQAPHGDVASPRGPQPATRHLGTGAGTALPRPPSFNEEDFSDKPELIRSLNPQVMNRPQIRRLGTSYRRYVESLRSVDQGIGMIMRTLRETGRLRNTYVFLLSDHGLFLGEHRYDWGKFMPYEASASPFMAVRGPGVSAGRVSREVTGNVDVPVTIMKLAGARPNYPVDGRSLRPYWRQPATHSQRPVPIVILSPYGGGVEASHQTGNEALARSGDLAGGEVLSGADDRATISRSPVLAYRGFRLGRYKYIRYAEGAEELYDLATDPDELENRADRPAYRQALIWMRQRLGRVTNCQGNLCRTEFRDPPLPVRPRD